MAVPNPFKFDSTTRQDLKTLGKIAPRQGAPCAFLAEISVTELYEIERMAGQGMNLAQICRRLRFNDDVFMELVQSNPSIREAFEAGIVRGVDDMSGALYKAGAIDGDVGAQRFYLERFGGPQFKPPAQKLDVTQAAPEPKQIDLERIDQAFDKQRALLSAPIDAEEEGTPNPEVHLPSQP